MRKAITAIGLSMFLFGAMGMDSESMVIPVIMTLIGMAITFVSIKDAAADFGE